MIKTSTVVSLILLLGMIISCSNFKEASLYPNKSSVPEPNHIGSFYALSIYDDFMNNEHWLSPNNGCLQASVSTDIKFKGNGSLHFQWDKSKEGCPWLGAGFGWDNWSPKNLSSILNTAAIEFKVRTEKGTVNGLPLAASLEDYGGNQAWIGMSPNTIKGGKVSEKWTTVTLPFSEFEYENSDIDLSNIKQFIIQFEAEGSIFIDEMKIVPFTGSLKKRMLIKSNPYNLQIDGNIDLDEWSNVSIARFNGHEIYLELDDEFLYVGAKIKDTSPLQNDKIEKNIWNGDAIEIAFSANPESSKKRKTFLYSDQHIGIRANGNPMIWDFKKEKEIKAEIKTKQSVDGYLLEAKIPLLALGSPDFQKDKLMSLELAVDIGNSSGKREAQHRWNSGSREGFHKNPSLWGELLIK